MQNRWANQFWFFVAALFVIACGDRAAVDKSYLESEGYSEFSENQQQEYSDQIKSYKSLQNYLAGYSQCQMGKEWRFPLQIDPNSMKAPGEKCAEMTAKFNRNYTVRSIGHSSFENTIIRWLVLQKESVYENSELLAATYRGDSLISFQTIGEFRENLTQDVSTRIEADFRNQFVDISAYKNRGIKYPFKYDNVIESTFRIDTAGVIKKQADQTKTYNSLPDFLAKFNECKLGKKWRLPMKIHTEELKHYGQKCGVLTDKLNPNFAAQTIGYSQFKDLVIRWIDLENDTFSEDRKLMAAVFRDNSLVSFQTVGIFQKHSSRQISTGIEVSQKEDFVYISTALERSIMFPIKHENVVESVYKIDSLGTIHQHQ